MALEDVEHCEDYCLHEDRIKKANEKMPDEDELYDIAELFIKAKIWNQPNCSTMREGFIKLEYLPSGMT